jgi:hypothetical protein
MGPRRRVAPRRFPQFFKGTRRLALVFSTEIKLLILGNIIAEFLSSKKNRREAWWAKQEDMLGHGPQYYSEQHSQLLWF